MAGRYIGRGHDELGLLSKLIVRNRVHYERRARAFRAEHRSVDRSRSRKPRCPDFNLSYVPAASRHDHRDDAEKTSDPAQAADHVEILMGMKMRKHQHDALEAVHDYLAHGGMVW